VSVEKPVSCVAGTCARIEELESIVETPPKGQGNGFLVLGVVLICAICVTGCWGGITSVPPQQTAETSWSQDEIDYLIEIGLGAEYGSSEPLVKKWTSDPRIKVFGSPTDADQITLRQVVGELNNLQGQITLKVVRSRPTIEIHFAPESRFSGIEPSYRSTNYGFFWTWWKDSGEIHRARILIATDHIDQRERSHLIREELTQCLGLRRDSSRYPKSVFYGRRTYVTEYAPIDRALVRMLYSDAIQPNMTGAQVREALKAQ
jgi:hypothetical protein